MITANKNLIDTKLEITENEKPSKIDTKPTSSSVSPASFNLRKVAPIIAGIKIRKENLAALTGSNPKILRNAIVVPEREIPGRIDKPWTTPTQNVFEYDKFEKLKLLL